MAYIPHTEAERQQMLQQLGLEKMADLFQEIPDAVKLQRELNLPGPLSELEVGRHLKSLAQKNINTEQYPTFLGAGAYDHFIPSGVQHILGRAEFYTAYTPYQPEISQGVLQSIFEFQSMICELTGMDVANASLYDGASATAEAAAMACAATRKTKVLVSAALHPEYRQVLQTYADGIGLQVELVPYREGGTDLATLEKLITSDVAAVIVQQPTFFGTIEDLTAAAELIHQAKGLLIAVVDPVSMGLLASPSTCGADIVVGEGQGLGIPMNFGGPHLGFMACTEKLLRRMPGRIVGETKDNRGNRGFVLTLQAREQHIRREKATSNICSNQALCALAATVHLSLLGKQGFRQVAEQSLHKAHYAYQQITGLEGYQGAWSTPFFKEFVVKLPKSAAEVNATLLQNGIIGGLDLGDFYPELVDHMLFCVTETRTKEDIDRLVSVLGGDM